MVPRRLFTVEHIAASRVYPTPFFIPARLILISTDRGYRRLGQTSSGEKERSQGDAPQGP